MLLEATDGDEACALEHTPDQMRTWFAARKRALLLAEDADEQAFRLGKPDMLELNTLLVPPAPATAAMPGPPVTPMAAVAPAPSGGGTGSGELVAAGGTALAPAPAAAPVTSAGRPPHVPAPWVDPKEVLDLTYGHFCLKGDLAPFAVLLQAVGERVRVEARRKDKDARGGWDQPDGRITQCGRGWTSAESSTRRCGGWTLQRTLASTQLAIAVRWSSSRSPSCACTPR